MLGKLLKHEFRATARIMWVLYAAMLVLSVGMHFAIRYLQGSADYLVLRILSVLVAVFWVLALIFGAVMTLVLMVQRFHKNLLTDEGYLMFTLPVSSHGLIFSKLIVSIVWSIVTTLVLALGIALAFVDSEFLQAVREAVQFVIKINDVEVMRLTVQGVGMLAELCLLSIVSVAASMLHFYAAMSLGYGFTGHKALWSVIWYFIITFVLQLLGMVLMMTVGNGIVNALDMSGVMGWHMMILSVFLSVLIVGAALYAVTWLNLKKRLNLA